jgi:hypothetical protein
MRLPIRLSNDKDRELTEALNTVAERLDRLVALAEQTNEILRSTSSTQPQRARRQRGRPRRTQTAAKQPRRGPRSGGLPRSPRLHEAIEAVLREAQEPLTAAEIAQRISDRQLFVPPRSGKPLSSSQVNARIANPHYKQRFRRVDGRVALAAGSAPA